MSNVIIITGNKYPCEDAGAIRQHATAKLFQELGYEVYVVGYGKSTNKRILQYEGVNYISFRPDSCNSLVRAIARLEFGRKALSFIKKHKDNLSIILVVDILPKAFKSIEKFGQKNGIVLLHDSVEWYSPEEFASGERNIEYKLKEITNTKIIKDKWRVIAISKYLEEHFLPLCEKTVRIPVIMDISNIQCRLQHMNRNKIVFAYVGGPGRKDYLRELIEGFCLLTDECLKKIELHLVGVNENQLIKICGLNKRTLFRSKIFMTAHGRLPHKDAVQWVIRSDYTLLLRDETLRYAKAGFPTKVVESLAYGTPVMCNLSSDLSEYLNDMVNAVIIKGHTPNDVKDAVVKVLSINSEDYSRMRRCARLTAENCFDYRRYKKVLLDLIDGEK